MGQSWQYRSKKRLPERLGQPRRGVLGRAKEAARKAAQDDSHEEYAPHVQIPAADATDCQFQSRTKTTISVGDRLVDAYFYALFETGRDVAYTTARCVSGGGGTLLRSSRGGIGCALAPFARAPGRPGGGDSGLE